MRIDRIRGKFLLAVLDPAAILDPAVCQRIYDLCRTRTVNRVGLVYPLPRAGEVLAFCSQVTTITGQPVEGFSHDEMPTIQ